MKSVTMKLGVGIAALTLAIVSGCSHVNESLVRGDTAESTEVAGIATSTKPRTATPNPIPVTPNPVVSVRPTYNNEVNVVVPVRNTALSIVGTAISAADIATNNGWVQVAISTTVAAQPSTNYVYQILRTDNNGVVSSASVTNAGKYGKILMLPVGPKGTIYKFMLKLTATNMKTGKSTTSWSANDVKVTYQ